MTKVSDINKNLISSDIHAYALDQKKRLKFLLKSARPVYELKIIL